MHFPNRQLERKAIARIAIALSIGASLSCGAETRPRLVTAEQASSNEESTWFVPKLPGLVEQPSSLDLSIAERRPAGADGFVRVEQSQFRDGSGQRLRLFGINLSGAACFPEAASATILARRFRQLGLNAVRFHGLDAGPPPLGFLAPGGKGLDRGALDRLDRFVSLLKDEGLYSVISLKSLGYASLSPELERQYPGGRVLDRFDPVLISELAERARQIATHHNPYTNQTYANEPALLAFEVVGEDTIFPSWAGSTSALPEPYRGNLRTLVDNLGAAAGNAGPSEDELLARIERKAAEDLINLLRGELGVRSLLVNTQASFGGLRGFLRESAVSDFIDVHGLWDHPLLAEPGKTPGFAIDNTSQLGFPEHGPLPRLASFRNADKPFVVSEYASSAPNDFAVEALPLLLSLGSFQDWDGLFPYAYAEQPLAAGGGFVNSFFEMASHPTKLAFLPLVARAFRMQLISPGESIIELGIGRDVAGASTQESALSTLWAKSGVAGSSVAVRRMGVRLKDGDAPASSSHLLAITPPLTSETREIIWEAEGREPKLFVNAPGLKLLVGHVTGKRIALDGLTLAVAPTSNGFAAVGLVALDDKPLTTSQRMLLVCANRAENTGMRFTPDRHALQSWGTAPVRTELVEVELELPGSGFRARALELDGTSAGELTLTSKQGHTRLSTAAGPAALWYVIER